MVITCRGSKGSIPVSGENISGTAVTPLMGFPFFKPNYVEGVTIDLYGCPFAQASIKDFLSNSMSPPYFLVRLEDFKARITYHGVCEGPFHVHPVSVIPILLSHPNQGIGYKFVEDGKSFVFLTDNELTYQHPGGLEYRNYREFSVGADLLIHDAEYTREDYTTTKGWGHSVYNDALQMALEANAKQFGLFHRNQERADTAVDEIVQDCHRIIGNQNSKLTCFAAAQGTQIRL